MNKKILNRSNITTAILLFFVVVLLVNPQAKALLIEGLMKIGLFQAPTKDEGGTANALGAAPDIVLQSSDGATVNLKELRGKVVFLNFWAPWCPPCIAEMPSVNKLYLTVKNEPDMLILTVDADGNFSKSLPFMSKNGYRLPVFRFSGQIPDGFISGTIPTTIIINKTGHIVIRHEGAADYADPKFIAYLRRLASQ